jgi:uncharacterized membrane protein YeaQ/YmgE (transglycosylase-associated protein family)
MARGGSGHGGENQAWFARSQRQAFEFERLRHVGRPWFAGLLCPCHNNLTHSFESKRGRIMKAIHFLLGFFEPPVDAAVDQIDRWRIKTTSATCIIILTVLLISAALFSSGLREFSLIVICGVFGWVLGWLAGVLLSPIRENETNEFKRVLGVIGTFISGWLAAKIDKWLDQAGGEREEMKTVVFCVLTAFAAFFTSAVSNYMWRRYVEKNKQKPAGPAITAEPPAPSSDESTHDESGGQAAPS